jgi:predicted aminopeptidase
VLRQAATQAKILNQRQRIDDMLRSPELSAEHRRKLHVVLAARRFGQRELGLKTTSAYTRFSDTGGKPLAHNLSASPKHSLRPFVWRFPIVGGLPYIGFFNYEEGLAEQDKLKANGWDTYYRPVSAFSSLGWFADPVYSPMLGSDVARLVDLVLHETTHTTIFLRNQVAFNESLAMFVGKQGALLFLARLYGPHSAEVRAFQASQRRRRKFSQLITRLYTRLDRLYASDLPTPQKVKQRATHFAWARVRYKELFPDPNTWGSFVRKPLNNAVLLSYGRYNQGISFHRRVYRCQGQDLGRMVALYKAAQRLDDPIDYVARKCGLRWYVKQVY